MTEAEVFEQARLYLPKYLSPAKQHELYEGLKAFPDHFQDYQYYSNEAALSNKLLQGDGWRGFVAIDFSSLTKKPVSGVIVSNSCDIDPDNVHHNPPNISFAPLIRLSNLRDRLAASGQTEEQVNSISESIRKQRTTSIFYLPSIHGVMEERIAILGDLHSHPVEDFLGCDRVALFTLSQTAFYLFLVKLSIHFTRMQEAVER